MFSEGGQTRRHCFLAMFPKGGQTRKHCFLAMFSEGGQTPENILSWSSRAIDFRTVTLTFLALNHFSCLRHYDTVVGVILQRLLVLALCKQFNDLLMCSGYFFQKSCKIMSSRTVEGLCKHFTVIKRLGHDLNLS